MLQLLYVDFKKHVLISKQERQFGYSTAKSRTKTRVLKYLPIMLSQWMLTYSFNNAAYGHF